jgi:hypothetical protein
MRAIVFAGIGGREVMRLEERPDPAPGSETRAPAATPISTGAERLAPFGAESVAL